MTGTPHSSLIGGTPSVRSIVLAQALRVSLRPLADHAGVGGPRLTGLRWMSDRIGHFDVPRGTTVDAISVGDHRAAVVNAVDADPRDGVMLYLHGGGFVLGSPDSHRAVAARLSRSAGVPVLLPAYRKAPEHPFPAAADDVLFWYRHLLSQGVTPDRIVVGGDSAGGHLLCGLIEQLRATGLPVPAGAVLFSPLLDLGLVDGDERAARRRDPFSSAAFARRAVEVYLGEVDPEDPRVDVLSADFGGWPPTLIQVGGTEMLLEDARALAAALAAAGVPHQLQVWRGQVHSFHLMSMVAPEPRRALEDAGRFVRDCLSDAAIDTVDRAG
ncbi:alpha/beta hydrolase [Nocardia sp. NPDC052001]|uniref:alpha/beta hydrolase n=1 Tax=Nocardia sp. NPDC052001 TaxID=3154853 RepID=UPI0034488EEC